MKKLVLVVTHALAVGGGFALGVYLLPILIAPPSPTPAEMSALVGEAQFRTRFERDLEGSDALHWGEGEVTLSATAIAHRGSLAPGPAYKLYLVPEFVTTEAAFLRVKDRSVRVGDVNTFDGFVVPVPAAVDVSAYRSVVIWCEAFSQFITAAPYR